jgi:hypothetical protein
MKVPSVKSVMKAVRARIISRVLEGFPEVPSESSVLEAEGSPAALPGAGTSPGGWESPGAAAPAEGSAENGVENGPENSGAPVESGGPGAGPETVPGGQDAEATVPEMASPFLAKVCRQLIERLGAEKAVEALIAVHYGELLDPSRYGPVTEFAEAPPQRPIRGAGPRGGFQDGERGFSGPGPYNRRGQGAGREGRGPGRRKNLAGEEILSNAARLYVGLGRQHGASARDVAALLIRAGGVPGRMVDDIEMKDYCAFATLPEDAARRACVFSRNSPEAPPIRFAKPVKI